MQQQSQQIEREIQQENKIFLGLTAKKLIAVTICGVVFIPLIIMVGMDYCYIPLFLAVAISWFFAWFEKDGLTGTQYLFKKTSIIYYKNKTRKYHTKNKYITALNKAYRKHRNIDMSDKNIQKQIKNEQKKQKNKKQVSNLKGIY